MRKTIDLIHPILDPDTESSLKAETEAAEQEIIDLIVFTRELMLSTPIVANSSEKQTPEPIPPTASTYLRAEDLTKREVSPDITLAIEKLGKDILDEAFECLGVEGMMLLEKFRDATTFEDKVVICKELEDLINKIGDCATYQFKEEDEESYEFPAMRLSPKLIGIYPNINVAPTCLGKSILMASFFAKLRLPMLHSGIVFTARQDDFNLQAAVIDQILEPKNHPDHAIPPLLKGVLESRFYTDIAQFSVHRGFHAATYAELEEGRWMQFDPNFGSARLKSGFSERLEEAYGQLLVLHEDDFPYAEIRMIFTKGLEFFFSDLAKNIGKVLPSKEFIDNILTNIPSSEVYSVLMEKVFLPLFPTVLSRLKEDDNLQEIRKDMDLALLAMDEPHEHSIHLLIMELLENYVFTDADKGEVLKSIERCKTDTAYRQRRVEDLCVAPLIVALMLQSRWQAAVDQKEKITGAVHICADLGLPEYRIGICALSDVAVSYGDNIPLSSWLAYWPSEVSLAEHHRQTPTEAQRHLAKHAIRKAKGRDFLTYPTLHDIFNASQGTPIVEVSDANRTPGA